MRLAACITGRMDEPVSQECCACVADSRTRAEKRKQNVVPQTGDFVQKTIASMYATPPEVIERVKKETSVAGRVGEKK